jgi:hypothetical protein
MADFRKWTLAFLSIMLLLFTQACSDKALQTTAKASRDISAANLAIQNTVIQAQQSGALTIDQARPIIQVTLTVAQADQQLNAAISGINALAPADKSKILAILQPVIDAVNQAVTTGVVPIQNQTIKTSITAALTTIQAALATVKAVVG